MEIAQFRRLAINYTTTILAGFFGSDSAQALLSSFGLHAQPPRDEQPHRVPISPSPALEG